MWFKSHEHFHLLVAETDSRSDYSAHLATSRAILALRPDQLLFIVHIRSEGLDDETARKRRIV